MWTRQQLKNNAKISMQQNYWSCVAVAFIMSVVEGIGAAQSAGSSSRSVLSDGSYEYGSYYGGGYHVGFHWGFPAAASVMVAIGLVLVIFGLLLGIFVGNVLRIGANRFFVLNRTDMVRTGMVFDGFRSGHYGNIVLTMFLRDLYTALWTLLFIIPGIIKSLEYKMVPYILAENPGMDQREAFAISRRMMDGEKADTFVLELSFIGWYLLAGITCGLVGIFYVQPYYEATIAELYAYNKGKAFHEGYIQ